MKKFLISILLLMSVTLISCKTQKTIICNYSELLKESYELTEQAISQNKDKFFLIRGVIKSIDSPKDQPYLNECIIYFYNNQEYDEKSSTGKKLKIKMKQNISRNFSGKEVVVKCRYKGMGKIKLEQNYNNYFWIEFKNGEFYN